MTPSFSCKPFFLKQDLGNYIKENLKSFVISVIFAILGVILGVVVACKIGEQETPYSVFAALFRLSFKPFSYILPCFLRFTFYLIVAALGFFLPMPQCYPCVALFFYGKSIGQTVTFCFLTDALVSAFFSLLLYLVLFIVGVFILFSTLVKVLEMKICYGACINSKNLFRILLYLLRFLLIYFALLLFLFLICCGVIYLIAIAV